MPHKEPTIIEESPGLFLPVAFAILGLAIVFYFFYSPEKIAATLGLMALFSVYVFRGARRIVIDPNRRQIRLSRKFYWGDGAETTIAFDDVRDIGIRVSTDSDGPNTYYPFITLRSGAKHDLLVGVNRSEPKAKDVSETVRRAIAGAGTT